MIVTIYTSKNKLLDKVEATSAYLPTLSGDVTILNNHNPIVGVLRKGEIIVRIQNTQIARVLMDKGYYEFSNNVLSILIQKTKLTIEDLERIQDNAIMAKDKDIRKDENISEENFEERKESEGF